MKKITEEMRLHDEWYKEVKNITIETLPKFLKKLSEDYEHDYGTICHAVTASALAAAKAMDRSPQGGITGFQASCIMWGFIKEWMHIKNEPLRLIKYDQMLYPQHSETFTSITHDTWKWLQKRAIEKLYKVLIFKKFGIKEILFRRFDKPGTHYSDQTNVHPEVFVHWKSVASGRVPFGYVVTRD